MGPLCCFIEAHSILGQHGETIRVWDVEEKKCVQEMERAHNGYVSSLLCVDDYLISG